MITATIKDVTLKFETIKASFSPSYIDKGTLAMLSVIDFDSTDRVLDLGCGYGVTGILAAKLIGSQNILMSDIDERFVAISKENSELNGLKDLKIVRSDGFKNIDDKDFTKIISNPPYHADFSIPKHFIEKGFNRLKIGGKMYMVTKRKDWYKNKLTAIFGGTQIYEIDGYFVFCAERRNLQYSIKAKIT